MLSEKKINKNYQKLVDTNSKYQFLTEEFFTKFGEEIKTASSLNPGYQYPGGAVQFALTVTKYGVMINGVLPKNKRFAESEIVKLSIMYSLQSMAEIGESELGERAFYKEESISYNLYRFVSTGCLLNADEFNFIANKVEFIKTAYALGNLISNGIELAGLENVLPESETTEEK